MRKVGKLISNLRMESPIPYRISWVGVLEVTGEGACDLSGERSIGVEEKSLYLNFADLRRASPRFRSMSDGGSIQPGGGRSPVGSLTLSNSAASPLSSQESLNPAAMIQSFCQDQYA